MPRPVPTRSWAGAVRQAKSIAITVSSTTLVLLFFGAIGRAQLTSFSTPDRVKYTKSNPFERFADGRPKVPDAWIRRLSQASSEEAWSVLSSAQYPNQWEGSWQILHPEKKLLGRVFTAQFMPIRPDVSDIIEADARNAGLGKQVTERVIDMLQPGDVVVVDVFGKIEGGTFGGSNLGAAIFGITGNGYVVNGSIRDLDAFDAMGMPMYIRGVHPGVRTNTMLMGVNVPIQIGGVTVMPGDVVLGDREGLTFIPPHLVRNVAEHSEESRSHDEWTAAKLRTGKYKSADLYPSPADPSLKKEYQEWLARRKAGSGIK